MFYDAYTVVLKKANFFVYQQYLGTLEVVSNLTIVSTSSAIVLIWQPPFTLNLTTAEPDIIYCIDIFNITDGETEGVHLISNCSVFEPLYKFVIENPDPEDLFQFVVTPRNNMKGARNGTPSAINVSYSLECNLKASS